MRIAIFTETWSPQINGVVTHIATLKTGLEQLGHDVLIVTTSDKYKKHRLSNGIIYCPAIKLKNLYGYTVSSPLSFERLRLVKKFKPDVIHVHNEFGVGVSGILIAKVLRIPLVYTLHTMYDDYVFYVVKKNFFRIITGITHKYARALAHASDAVIGPSPKIRDYFAKFGVKKDISVIPNSAELDKFNPEKADLRKVVEIRRRFGFTEKDIVFCFCGRLGKEKNLSLLLNYWAQKVCADDNFKLLIIGGGPCFDAHKAETRRLGISNTVFFAGRIEHTELLPYYACCDAYISASQSEVCPIALLEAMAAGLPVIHIKDELNAVIPGVNGYFYRDADEMFGYMNSFKKMSKRGRDEFKKAARESVMYANPNRLANDIVGVYESVMGKKAGI